MPMVRQPLRKFPLMAKAAEDAGFDSVWDYEVYENPLLVLATAALATERIELGTGLATALSRSPFELANAAADVDQLSDGRLLLGVGLGIPGLMQTLHGADVDRPLRRMREYATALRLAWAYLSDQEPAEFVGDHYRFVTPPFNPLGARSMARVPPLYLGGMNPRMIELAGELGDGLMGGGYSRRFVEETVLPRLAAGAERGGKPPEEVEFVCQVICCVSPDRAEALRRARIHVGQLVANPVQDGIVAAHGLEAEVLAVRESIARHGVEALEDVTDDRLVETFSIAGTPEECREQLRAWHELCPHVMLHTPYVPPLTPEETEDAFHQIVAAFARTPAAG